MLKTIIIIILICIIIFLILDKKKVKMENLKLFLLNIYEIIQKKSIIFFNKLKHSLNKSREKIKKHMENVKQKKLEIQKQDNSKKSFNEETKSNISQKESSRTIVKVVRKDGFFTEILCIILLVCAGLFVYKKIMIDYDGIYATDRLIYTDEYGFCMLITYHPNYQKGKARGFAITHIPFASLFTETIQSNPSNDTVDSKEMLDAYQLLSTWENKGLEGYPPDITSIVSSKSFAIGNCGNYFIINAKTYGY